jgi:hypothetical protein
MTDQELANNIRRTYEAFKEAVLSAQASGISVLATYKPNAHVCKKYICPNELTEYNLEIHRTTRL